MEQLQREESPADTALDNGEDEMAVSMMREQRMRTELKRVLDDGGKKVSEHESTIKNLETDIDNAKGEVHRAQTQLEQLQAEITQLRLRANRSHGFSDGLNSAANITLVALGVLCASIFAFLLTQRLATSLYPPDRPTPL
ncbi:chromosome segregation protein [Carpediemonas membranifera]|uniref:Chromosome segregation protein n=1 Tax=Carpediemonas membranifera TaxID=201153 RepID=A0A8J6BAV1_9EUKA|nr:chromosome segregation protein [Carpediemonas membranifera]|eukprot:KAG9393522.1 chromosome segregation protein [Carpediemonas membranifera]